MIKRYTKILSVMFLVLLMSCFVMPLFSTAHADSALLPNFISEDGILYHMEGPDTVVLDLDILGEHTITLTDGEAITLDWDYNVPGSTIGGYPTSFTYGPATFSRVIYIVITNSLVMEYSREAFEAGEQFLTGELTQHIVAYERVSSTWPVVVSYSYDQVELVISTLQAGNFQSISEGNMEISFDVTTDKIINGFNPSVYTYMNSHYNELDLVFDYKQLLQISSDFIMLIVPEPIVIERVYEQVRDMVDEPPETPEEIIEIVQDVQTETENIITEYVHVIPSPIEAAAGAVASVLVVSLAGGVASIVSGAAGSAAAAGAAGAASGISGAVSSGSAGLSNSLSGAAASGINQAAQVLAQSSTAATGGITLSFIKDIITGLRDMFMDEGRSHASGRVTENLKK